MSWTRERKSYGDIQRLHHGQCAGMKDYDLSLRPVWPSLPPTGSLIVWLSGVFCPLVPSHLSLLVQICPSYQLDSEGQASPVSGLRSLPQPLVCVLAGHPGSFGSRSRDPSPRAPTMHHTPSGRPGKCSTPRARLPQGYSSAWPGHPPAEREPGSRRCTQRPLGASRAGPGRAAGGRNRGQALGCLACARCGERPPPGLPGPPGAGGSERPGDAGSARH